MRRPAVVETADHTPTHIAAGSDNSSWRDRPVALPCWNVRLFVAIEIDARVQAAAAHLLDGLQRRAAQVAPRARISWVAADRLHLTLRFIGEVDDGRTRRIEEALGTAFPINQFEIRISGTGVFPRSGPPRVIWIGVADETGQLEALHREVEQRLTRAGVAPDHRPFSPHLTLGRVRLAAGLRAGSLLEGLTDVGLGDLRVDRAVLMESRLSAAGAIHTVRLATRLTGT
jgi:2'-5' RNA ligase